MNAKTKENGVHYLKTSASKLHYLSGRECELPSECTESDSIVITS